jgi:hypothetical protein
LPKVRGIAEAEMFKVVKTGKKTAKKGVSNLFLFLRAFSWLARSHGCASHVLEYRQTFLWGNSDACKRLTLAKL